MQKQYTPEQLDQIYQKLPEELKEAIFSVETSENIGNACETYGITDERATKIATYAGQVLMGLILPAEFQGVLEKEVGLPPVLAQAISRELNRFVFYPVKPALEQLHNMEVGKTEKQTEGLAESPQGIQAGPPQSPPTGRGLGGEDKYREQIE